MGGGNFDLGGSAPQAVVAANRARLRELLGVERVLFLRQVHGVKVADADAIADDAVPEADAAVTRRAGIALAILTADCLPVLFADGTGRCVAAAHAGWRGLAAGVLEATVAAMGVEARTVRAWIGPAIGPDAFEIGPEVRAALREGRGGHASTAALDAGLRRGQGDRWHADLGALASVRLRALGLRAVECSGLDVHARAEQFFSHRRDAGRTGRQATLIWFSPPRRS
jgi:YfiH family protein